MKPMLAIMIVLTAGQAATSGQAAAPVDQLALLAPLLGKWAGPTEGEPGTGTTERDVNQFALDPGSTPDRLVFTTEAIENIPPGWRARETYVIGPDRLEEIFELAEPGQPFAVYSRNRLTRVH